MRPTVLLTLAIALGVLSGCSSTDEPAEATPTTAEVTPTPEEQSTVDPVDLAIQKQLDAFTEMGTRALIEDALAQGTAPEVLAAPFIEQHDAGQLDLSKLCLMMGLIKGMSDDEIVNGCRDEWANK